MKLRKIATLLVSAALVVTTASVAAPPASAHTGHYTPAQFRSWSTSKYLGPTSATKYQRLRITGWYKDQQYGVDTGKYLPSIAFHQYPNPNAMRAAYAPSADGGRYAPRFSWPWDWDWGHIFGQLWGKIGDCLSGAVTGTIPAVTGTVAVNLIFRGGRVFVGPYGYAAIAIGGCIAGIVG